MRIIGCVSILLASVLGTSSSSVNAEETESNKNQRREQDLCSVPSGGCGYGIWNDDSCECACIPVLNSREPYLCFCPNFNIAWIMSRSICVGCTPDVDCPYYADTFNGICESGPTISQGIYSVYRTKEECCNANYPTDISTCLQLKPTSSPTPSPVQPTASPTIPKAIGTEAISSQPTESQSTINNNAEINTFGVMLTPIPISFIGLPSEQLNDARRGEMSDVIRSTLAAPSDELNVTILSIDVVDNLFLIRDSSTLALELRIEVTGDRVIPEEVHAAFLDTLQNHIDDVATALQGAWVPEVFTDSVILSIGDVSTTLNSKQPDEVGDQPTTPQHDGEENSVPVWAVVLFPILFALLCGGLMIWQRRRRRDKDLDNEEAHHNSFFDEEMSFDESRLRQTSSQKPLPNNNVGFQQSIRSFSSRSTARMGPTNGYGDDAPQLSSSKVSVRQMELSNPSLGRSNNNERVMNARGYPARQRNNVRAHNSLRTSSETPIIAEYNEDDDDEEEDRGYDGGKSSSRLDIEQDQESDDSSDHNEVEDDNESEDDGLVLGLLYYDGATSAEESEEGRDSGRSRRSRRKNRSMHSKGSGKSSKSRNTRRSRRKQALEKLEEEPQQQRQQDPEGFRESELECTVNMPLQGDNLLGSVVCSGPGGNLDDYQLRPIRKEDHGGTIPLCPMEVPLEPRIAHGGSNLMGHQHLTHAVSPASQVIGQK